MCETAAQRLPFRAPASVSLGQRAAGVFWRAGHNRSAFHRFAKATYRLNWPSDPSDFVVGDVCRQSPATIPPADVLVAGFPCQSFSNAGRKLAFDDDRGQLFYELVRLATACRFRALLLENVRGLLEPSVMAAVVRALAAAGYTVSTREFDAATLLPQRRRCVLLAC